MYIPKINLPIEGVEHARWLEKRSVDQETFNTEVRRFMDRLSKEQAAGARPVTSNTGATSGGGVPAGGPTSSVLRKSSNVDYAARWSPEWQGLLPEYWVTLADGAPSYTVSGLGLSGTEAEDIAMTMALLPRLSFADNGHKLMPFYQSSYPDALGGSSGSGQTPIYLNVKVDPGFDGDTFTIVLPSDDNLIGSTTPYYTFVIENIGSFEAVVEIDGPTLIYAGTTVPVFGGDTWTLGAGNYAAWHVLNIKEFFGMAIPAPGNSGDSYFDSRVRATSMCFPFHKEGTLSTSTGGLSYTNDRPGEMRFGTLRASVGTAPTGADIEIDVFVDGVSILTAPLAIPAGQTTASVTPSTLFWFSDEVVTMDVLQVGSSTPGSDLTVQVWAG